MTDTGRKRCDGRDRLDRHECPRKRSGRYNIEGGSIYANVLDANPTHVFFAAGACMIL